MAAGRREVLLRGQLQFRLDICAAWMGGRSLQWYMGHWVAERHPRAGEGREEVKLGEGGWSRHDSGLGGTVAEAAAESYPAPWALEPGLFRSVSAK